MSCIKGNPTVIEGYTKYNFLWEYNKYLTENRQKIK